MFLILEMFLSFNMIDIFLIRIAFLAYSTMFMSFRWLRFKLNNYSILYQLSSSNRVFKYFSLVLFHVMTFILTINGLLDLYIPYQKR